MTKKTLLEKYHDGFSERLHRRGEEGLPPKKDRAEEIVFVIIDDLSDRKGLDYEWSNIDADVQEEIFGTLIEKVNRLLK